MESSKGLLSGGMLGRSTSDVSKTPNNNKESQEALTPLSEDADADMPNLGDEE